MTTHSQNLLHFIDNSPTAFHAVTSLESDLLSKNYTKLSETENWDLQPNSKYYITRADSSIIIFNTPKNIDENSTFKIIGAHTDSPCLKIKSNPTSQKEGYQLLNIEVYGGVLLTSWFDKDLKIGGRVFTEDSQGNLKSSIVKLPFKVRIPRLAIHLDRAVNNEGFKVNPQTHMFPVIGLNDGLDFNKILQQEIGTTDSVLSWDLFLFDTEPCSFGGINEEFVFAPRLDNLASVHASFEALINQENADNDFQVAAYFNHEEIGSTSQNGAGSNFMEITLKRMMNAFGKTIDDLHQMLAKSFFISADMAHAIHPNYPNVHDQNHKPYINKGPVLKSNANVKYATDALSIAKFKQWCNATSTPFQDFCSSNDMGCGSTIGPMTASNLGIPTIDIGNPMLSMHSIREMAGTKDHDMIITVFNTFYKG